MSLAHKLKDLRSKKGQSLQQVADAMGVSKAHIWELEVGKSSNPGLGLMKKLADHFSVTIAFLVDDVEIPEGATPVQFFRDFEGELSPEDWAMLRRIAERFKEKDGKFGE